MDDQLEEKTEEHSRMAGLMSGTHEPIAVWSGTIEVESSIDSKWEVRLHEDYVVVVFPDAYPVRRGKYTAPRVALVTSTRRYYGLLHRSLVDLLAARPPSLEDVLDLVCQYHGSD